MSLLSGHFIGLYYLELMLAKLIVDTVIDHIVNDVFVIFDDIIYIHLFLPIYFILYHFLIFIIIYFFNG